MCVCVCVCVCVCACVRACVRECVRAGGKAVMPWRERKSAYTRACFSMEQRDRQCETQNQGNGQRNVDTNRQTVFFSCRSYSYSNKEIFLIWLCYSALRETERERRGGGGGAETETDRQIDTD